MNILIVTEGAYPESIGGSQTLVDEMARGLSRRGHSLFHLMASEDPSKPSEEEQEGVKVFRYFLAGRSYLGDAFRLPWRLLPVVKKIIQEHRIEVIFLNHVMSGFWISLFCRGYCKLVYSFNSPWYREYEIRVRQEKDELSFWDRGLSFLLRWIQGVLMKRAGEIIVLSRYMRELALEIVPTLGHKIVRIRPGIDLTEFKPVSDRERAREALGVSPSSVVILAVRRFVPRMGMESLIEAMSWVIKEYPQAQLWIIGRGILEKKLKAKVQELGIGNAVKFLGVKEKSELIECYQAADLSVMPSVDLEGFGFSTLESLACGTPVVGTSVGGTTEILGGLDPQFLVAQADPKMLAQGIEKWVSEKNALPEWGRKARVLVEENYALNHMIDDVEKVFSASSKKR